MSTIDDLNSAFDANDWAGIVVTPQDAGQPRFPFVFLIDVSASTGSLPDGADRPDIDSLNIMLRDLFARLHSGAPGDPIELQRPYIDVAVLIYGDKPRTHMTWTRADSIPPSPPPIVAQSETTNMGLALLYAIDHVRSLQASYAAQKVSRGGVPIIFHITDGGASDITIGSAEQQKLRAAIDHLDPGGEAPKRMIIYHFVTPNGFRLSQINAVRDASGALITGEKLLVDVFGRHSVVPLQEGVDSFDKLARFIIRTISTVSQGRTPTATMLHDVMQQFGGGAQTP